MMHFLKDYTLFTNLKFKLTFNLNEHDSKFFISKLSLDIIDIINFNYGHSDDCLKNFINMNNYIINSNFPVKKLSYYQMWHGNKSNSDLCPFLQSILILGQKKELEVLKIKNLYNIEEKEFLEILTHLNNSKIDYIEIKGTSRILADKVKNGVIKFLEENKNLKFLKLEKRLKLEIFKSLNLTDNIKNKLK